MPEGADASRRGRGRPHFPCAVSRSPSRAGAGQLPAEQEVDALTRAELAFGARGNEVARERMNAGECLSAANDAWRNAHPGKRLVALVVDGERRDVAAYGHDGMYRLKSGDASTEATGARLADGVLTARFNGHARRCRVHLDAGHVAVHDAAGFRHAFERAPAFAWVLADAVGDDRVRAPMPGRIVLVRVSPGDTVTAGQDLLVMEAMKMELALKAPRDGTIESVGAAQGDFVEADRVLVRLAANDQA